MRLGFHIPLSEDGAAIRGLGERLLASGHFDWIEVKYPHDVLGFDGAAYDHAVRRLVEEYQPGVSLHVPTHYDLGMWSTAVRDRILDQVEASIDYSAELGASVVPIHPGTILHMDIPNGRHGGAAERVRKAAQRKKARAADLTVFALQRLAERAEQHGITLALENVLLPQEIVHSAEDLAELLDRVNRDNVRALFDSGHANRVGLHSPSFIRSLGHRLAHVHVNDNDGTCDLHQQLGEGTVDFAGIFTALIEQGFSGAVVVETAYRTGDDLAESARRIRGYLERLA
jgi:sugar phosphate isomerase/epimerase